ncbi:hypothetical protein R1sor_025373 [Riccia sorocarpa]|uniref:ATP-dependent (S)-NAD(P)H-hydrate dehydratase n=1 Tax=Riccia sorocarpa TaxID=122646 RepID=A0ABD3GBI1_9MARC
MSFLTEKSIRCWKVSPRRPSTITWSSSSEPIFNPYTSKGTPNRKAMHSGISVVQRLTYLGTLKNSRRVLLQSPTFASTPVSRRAAQLGSITSGQVTFSSSSPSQVTRSQSFRPPIASSGSTQASGSQVTSSVPKSPEPGTQSVPSFPSPILATHLRPIVTTAASKPSVSSSVKHPSVKVRASTSSNVQSRDRNSKVDDMADLVKPVEQILPALSEVVPTLGAGRHKGQAGKIAVIGGCREYTGAPYYAAFSALRLGADISHVFCTEGAGTVIKSYSPELIVHPVLRESHDTNSENLSWRKLVEKVVGDVGKWLDKFHCVVIGPGLGRDELLMECVSEIITMARERSIPLVIDGDGLFIITNKPELISGYRLAVLTPNVVEHKRLVGKIMEGKQSVPDDLPGQLKALAERMGGVTIVQKGKLDLISDGQQVVASDYFGSPRRCGGQGDVLSGSTALFFSWARQYLENEDSKSVASVKERISSNPAIVGSLAGSLLLRKSAGVAFSKHKRSTLTTDIIDALGPSMEEFFPVQL